MGGQRQEKALVKALKKQRDILDVIMENTEAHLAYLDRDFNFVMVNTTYAKGSGHAKEQLIGRNHFELFPNAENQEIFERVRDSGQPVKFAEKPFVFPDQPWRGTTYWDWTLVPAKDASGQVQSLALSLLDVTERVRERHLEEALRQIVSTMTAKLDLREIMEVAMIEGSRALEAESAAIILREDERWRVAQVNQLPEETVGQEMSVRDIKLIDAVLKSQQLAAVEDVLRDSRIEVELVERYQLRSLLVLPLIVRGKVIAMLSFHYHSRQVSFPRIWLDFAGHLASSLSLALDNARLFAVQKNELARTKLLQNVATAATGSSDFKVISKRILAAIKESLRPLAGDIRIFDAQRQELVLLASFGLLPGVRQRLRRLPLDDESYLAVRAFQQRSILSHQDDRPSREPVDIWENHLEQRRYVVVPIEYRDQVLGTFALMQEPRRDYQPEELRLFQSIARILGQALESAFLFEAEAAAKRVAREELEASQVLSEAARLLSASLSLSKVIQQLADIIIDVTKIKRVVINQIDPDVHEVTVLAALGGSEAIPGTSLNLVQLPPEQRRLFHVKQATLLDYAADDLSLAAKRRGQSLDAKLVLFIPLMIGGEIMGNIVLDDPGERHAFTQREIELVEAIASQAAVAIENARLHQKSLEQSHTFEAVLQMGGLVTSVLSMGEILAPIVSYSLELLNAQASLLAIRVKHGEVHSVVASEGFVKDLSGMEIALDEAIGPGLRDAKPVFINNIKKLTQLPLFAEAYKEGFLSAALAPISYEAELQGLLVIMDRQHTFPSEEYMAALKLFSSQVAIAIRNAERYETEHYIAHTLQQALLPDATPKFPDLEIEFHYRSASRGAAVGGDFYDFFELSPGVYGIVLGDVAGKGIDAATEIAKLKSLLRDRAFSGMEVDQVLKSVSQALYQQGTDRYSALSYAVYDSRTSMLTFVNSGNPFPYMPNRDAFIEATGVLLAVTEGQEYQAVEIELKPGDVIIMYTDGLVDARRDYDLFGQKRARQFLLDRYGQLSLKELLAGLVQEAERFSLGQLPDDVLTIGIRKTSVSGNFEEAAAARQK